MTICDLLDAVQAALGVSSDRALALKMHLPTSLVHRYRQRLSLPSDANMLRFCDVAAMPAERGLLLLNLWRTDGAARTTYRGLLEQWEASHPRADNKKAA